MPRPAYIVCAKSGAVDEATNNLSFFDLLDTVVVSPQEKFPSKPVLFDKDSKSPEMPASPFPPFLSRVLAESLSVRIVSTWVQEETDTPDRVYEVQFALVTPIGEDWFATPPVSFSFSKTFHRVSVRGFPIVMEYPTLGLYHVESRLRRAGESDWLLRQSYPFLVQSAEDDSSPRQPKEQADPLT